MKKVVVYCIALALMAMMFTGCTSGGNVSEDKDGMIESSSATMPTESTRRPTTESSAATLPSTDSTRGSDEPSGSMEEDRSSQATQESSDDLEGTGRSRGGRTIGGDQIF